MKQIGSVLNNDFVSYLKKEFLEQVREYATEKNVKNLSELNSKVNDVSIYQVFPDFPIDARNRPSVFYRELLDLLQTTKATSKYTDDYVSQLLVYSEEMFLNLKELVNNYYNISQDTKKSLGYSIYMNNNNEEKSLVLPVSFSSSDSKIVGSVYSSCFIGLNKQVVLPIEEKIHRPIKKIQFSNNENTSESQSFQIGSFLFKWFTTPKNEDIIIEATMQNEERINHLRIPLSLPIPKYISRIELLDSNRKTTRIFLERELKILLKNNPTSLELFFAPVEAKTIKVVFKKKLNLIKQGVFKLTKLDTNEKVNSKIFAESMQLVNSRNQIQKDNIQTKVNEELAKKNTANPVIEQEVYAGVIGAFIEVNLISYKNKGSFQSLVYEGSGIKYSYIKTRGKTLTYELEEKYLEELLETPLGFVSNRLIVSAVEEQDQLVKRFFVNHPQSRPFNINHYELFENSGDLKNKSTQSKSIDFYSSFLQASDIKAYIITDFVKQEVDIDIVVNPNVRDIKVVSNKIIEDDLVVEYQVPFNMFPFAEPLSDNKPYNILYNGSIYYADNLFDNLNCQIHYELNLSRVGYNKHVTPVILESEITLGLVR